MDTRPKLAIDLNIYLQDSFSEKDLIRLASSMSQKEIEFAIDCGLLPIVFSYLKNPETAHVSAEAIKKAVMLCPSRHENMINAFMVEELISSIMVHFKFTDTGFDILIGSALFAIQHLVSNAPEVEWHHVKDVPYILEAVLFLEPVESPKFSASSEYRTALEIFALLTQRSSDARSFLLKQPLMIKRIISRADFNSSAVILTLKCLAETYYSSPFSVDLFQGSTAQLVHMLEGELSAFGTKPRTDALEFTQILLSGPNFQRTKVFVRKLFPPIVRCMWSFQFDQIKLAFAIVNRLMNNDLAKRLYKFDEAAIMRGYLETLVLINHFDNFSCFNFSDVLKSIKRLFEINEAKAVAELKIYESHKGVLLMRRLMEMHEEPEAQILAVDILCYID